MAKNLEMLLIILSLFSTFTFSKHYLIEVGDKKGADKNSGAELDDPPAITKKSVEKSAKKSVDKSVEKSVEKTKSGAKLDDLSVFNRQAPSGGD